MTALSLDPEDPGLLEAIKTGYLDRKIRGEDKNKLLLFLLCASAFTKNPLSAIVKGRSSAGKSHLVNRVLDVFRKMGIVIEFSRITGAYLENMASKDRPRHPNPKDPDYEAKLEEYESQQRKPRSIDLTGKILFIDELRGIQNAQAPKLLISEGRLRLGTVINGEPVTIEVRGTPVIITTTTLAVLDDPEFENRVIPIQIDESEEQTQRVLEFEAEEYEDPAQDLGEHQRIQALIGFLDQLKPYGVANPYAGKLAEDYPKRNIEARRDYRKLMNLCNVVTWLHQHQRTTAKKGLDIVSVAELKDLETVKDLALASLRESLAGYSEKEGRILQVLRENLREGLYQPYPIKQIYTLTHRQTRRGEQWTRDHVKRLVEEGYVEERQVTGKEWRLEYRYSELPPETLEIRTKGYSAQVLGEWAQEHGYRLLGTPVLDLETTQGQPKTAPLERIEPVWFPKSEFGHHTLPAGEFGVGQGGNGLLSKSKPGEGTDSDGEELALVRRAVKEECDRIGYAHVAKVRYRVQDKIPDPNKVTRLLVIMGKNGELSPFGADCFKLQPHA